MDLQYVTPALERLWIDEVLHLHALWHRGPPPNPTAHSTAAAPSSSAAALRPANSTAFKRVRKRQRKERKRQRRAQEHAPTPAPGPAPPSNAPAPDVAWPCPPTPVHKADAGWADPAPKPAAAPAFVSTEEKAGAFAVHTQKSALSTCLDFFKNNGSDNEDEEDGEAMDEEDGEGEDSEVYKFFLCLFGKDGELKGYYEKNWEKGEFCCLVCGGIGAKVSKRFSSCVALVQHSNSISKTKRRMAHRAFGRAVCQVLGWDISRLPSIVLSTTEPHGQLLATDSNWKDHEHKEGSPDHVEDTPKIADENVGSPKENLMEVAETREVEGLQVAESREVEGLREDYDQKEGSSDHIEEASKNVEVSVGTQREDLMDM